MITLLIEDLKLVIEGRRPLPVGTMRSRNGRDYVKTKSGWNYVPQRNRKSKKAAQAHFAKTGKVPHGFKLKPDSLEVGRKKNPRALSKAKKEKQARLAKKVDKRTKGHKDLMKFVKSLPINK